MIATDTVPVYSQGLDGDDCPPVDSQHPSCTVLADTLLNFTPQPKPAKELAIRAR